jgi:hypothetical protein
MNWSHPRIANPEALKDEWPEIAVEATAALWRRREVYSALVDKNADAETLENAKAEGLIWKIIAADWDWIVTGLGEAATRASLPDRITALDAVLARFLAVIDQQGGSDTLTDAQATQGGLLAAMRWWAEVEATQPINRQARFLASCGHHWREANGHPPLGKMISNPNEERKVA